MSRPAAQPKSRADATLDAAATPCISPNFPKTSSRKERAAILLAEDDLTDEAIAEVVGVTKRTITNWKQDPEFAALVGDYHGQIVAQSLKLPIAKKHHRVSILNDLHTKSLAVIAHRAARYSEEIEQADSARNATRRFFGDDAPAEAMTGLLVGKKTANPRGKETVNWEVDTGLMKEIRDLHKQAAQELGQWEDKAAVNVDGGMRIEIVGMADEDLP